MTAFYLGSGEDPDVFESLAKQRTLTTRATEMLKDHEWFEIKLKETVLTDLEALKKYIKKHRENVNKHAQNVTVTQNIEFYTEIIQVFIGYIRRVVENPPQVAMSALVSATDSTGIQRALGSTMLAQCSADYLDWFIRLESEKQADFQTAYQYRSNTERSLKQRLASDPELLTDIEQMKEMFFSYEFESCDVTSDVDNIEIGEKWFSRLTQYLDNVLAEASEVFDEIKLTFDEETTSLQNDVILQACILAVSTVMCLIVTVWYVTCIRRMTSRVQRIAQHSLEMSRELGQEQRKTARLLYEILPKGIASNSRPFP